MNTMGGDLNVKDLTDSDLLAGTRRLVGESNRAFAALLASLAEIETRGLYRTRACSSLYAYCIYELRFSEDAACRRVAAARLVRRFPSVLGAVERGELHLTGLILLAPHLTEANMAEVLQRAKFRTKKEILKLVRLLSPLPDVPSRIEPLGLEHPRPVLRRPSWSEFVASFVPVRHLEPDERPESWVLAPKDEHPSADTDVDLESPPARIDVGTPPGAATLDGEPAPARIEPEREALLSGPQRYKVQFTANEEYVALVEEAKALLSHALPSGNLTDIHLRAMRTLVAELKKRKYASTRQSPVAAGAIPNTSPSNDDDRTPSHHDTSRSDHSTLNEIEAPSPRQRGRKPPAAIRRAVFERDGNRCTYVDDRGERCRETARLEFHHHDPFALGGGHQPENLSLRCAQHNALAAEQDFGRAFMATRRDALAHQTWRAEAHETLPDGWEHRVDDSSASTPRGAAASRRRSSRTRTH